MGKFYTDIERFNAVKEFRTSNKNVSEFAREKGISRTTLRDRVNAYNNLSGDFINVNKFEKVPNLITKDEDLMVNFLTDQDKKSRHFTRFDHSIVMIEYKGIKISTSLEQALKLLEQIYEHI